jgi:6-phospho-beta-glucosidase
MNIKELKNFPKDFLWGASTSSFQVEGGANEGGKGLTVMDVKPSNPGRCDFSVASDFYNHYKEDIALMAEMGFKAYRMSISWARILPNGDDEKVNEEGIRFYKDVFNECHKYGIEPVVTIFHFDLPLNLVDSYGGWSNRKMIDLYENYAKVLFENYKDDVKYWLTYNEQNMLVFFGAADMMGKEKRLRTQKEIYDECHIQLVAQAKVMKLCHEMCPGAKIGSAPNITSCYPKDSDPLNSIAAMDYSTLRNWLYLDTLCKGRYPDMVLTYFKEHDCMPNIYEGDIDAFKEGNPDFIAFNYYGGSTVEYMPMEEVDYSGLLNMRTDDMSFLAKLMEKPGVGRAVSNEFIKTNDYGMQLDPIGIRVTLREMYDRYHLPLLITENGCGTKDVLTEDGKIHDDYRIDYLAQHIEQLKLAINEGVDLMGYCPWSAIDLVSTREGCSKRYGFVYVDRDEFDLKDMSRIRKDSFHWYKKVIESNGENLSYEKR